MAGDDSTASRAWRAIRGTAERCVAPVVRSPGRALDVVEDRHRRHELLATWRDTVRATGLSHRTYTRSGSYQVEPRVVGVAVRSSEPRIERLTIALGRGQTVADVAEVRDEIATAFDVQQVALRELPGRRLEIVLRPDVRVEPPNLVGVPSTQDGVA